VVAQPATGLDDDQVEPEREMRNAYTRGQGAEVEQAVRRRAETRPLAMVDSLLGQAKGATAPPAHLHDHERRRWTRIDRDDVEFIPSDVDIPRQDRPAVIREPIGGRDLGRVAEVLGWRPPRIARVFGSHAGSLNAPAYAGLIAERQARLGSCSGRPAYHSRNSEQRPSGPNRSTQTLSNSACAAPVATSKNSVRPWVTTRSPSIAIGS
jgi:hypothetical protein